MNYTLKYEINSVKVLGLNTIVYLVDCATGEVFVGTSRCHPEDNFNIHIGIEIAVRRALAKMFETRMKYEMNEISRLGELFHEEYPY